VYPENDLEGPVVLSEVAHIVSSAPDGPRGHYPLPPEDRDKYDNLILLCEEHHHIVDSQPSTYTVQRLRQMKANHEALVDNATLQAVKGRKGVPSTRQLVPETLYSTLLPVLRMPLYVYWMPCGFDDSQERQAAEMLVRPDDRAEMYPFIIRGGKLYCFQNLRYKGGPFHNLASGKTVERCESRLWWDDADRMKWFVTLLNRSLNKLTGRKGLNLDKRHRRYFFMPDLVGDPKEIVYRPLNKSTTTRQVVWQPITRKTGLPKSYWYHQAVSLKFHRVSDQQWCVSIRPEIHVTQDGSLPLESELIGARVTRKKARMFNIDLLREVQFWRDFLSESKPRIIMSFGKGQNIIISTTLIQTEVRWPGMPEEYQRAFKNAEYPDDLFSLAEMEQLDAEHDEDEEWEDSDEEEEPPDDEQL
jgi:hypothetical protein